MCHNLLNLWRMVQLKVVWRRPMMMKTPKVKSRREIWFSTNHIRWQRSILIIYDERSTQPTNQYVTRYYLSNQLFPLSIGLMIRLFEIVTLGLMALLLWFCGSSVNEWDGAALQSLSWPPRAAISPAPHLPLPETSPGRDLQSEMDPSNERKDKGVHFIDTVFFV